MGDNKKSYHKIIRINEHTAVEFFFEKQPYTRLDKNNNIIKTESVQYHTRIFSTKKQDTYKIKLDDILPDSTVYHINDHYLNSDIHVKDTDPQKDSRILLNKTARKSLDISYKNRKNTYLLLSDKTNDIEVSIKANTARNKVSVFHVHQKELDSIMGGKTYMY